MTDYSNWKVLKSVINYTGDDEEKQKAAQAAQEEYTAVAEWCNESGKYSIEEDETYYKVVAIPEPTPPTEDELKAQVRAVRDSYLQATDYTQLPDAPFTAEEKAEYADYRQYLRDYTETEDWWESNPKTFEEWKAGA
jgi:hypothetical protein